MCTYFCLLLLGGILVASVQGLTKDQEQQILEIFKADQNDVPGRVDGLGTDIEEDVDVEELLERLGLLEKKNDDDDVVDDTKEVGWYHQGTKQPKSERARAPWYYGSTRRGNKRRVGWNWATKGQKSMSDDTKEVGWFHQGTKQPKSERARAPWYYGSTRRGNKRRVGWNWVTKGQKSMSGNKKRVGWNWASKPEHNEKDEPWCQAHSSGSGHGCCVERTMGKTKYHLDACMNVLFHPKSEEYSIYFSLNGYEIFHKDMELKTKEDVEECFTASHLVKGREICFQLNKINAEQRSMCAAIQGKPAPKGVDSSIQLGCFTIASGDENEAEQVPVGMETEEQATRAEMFRALADQLDLSDADDETSSTEDDTLRFEN